MKTVIIDGRIGKDGAKVLSTKGGKNYIRFSLANDSFVDGTNKTEWFDVTSFDPYVVENRSKYLTQGRYIIVNGSLKSEVSVKDGKVYLNHYVNATNIELPSFGTKKEENNEPKVSTYTGGTKSDATVEEAAPVTAPVATPAPQVSTVAASGWSGEDDLPF